MGKPITTLAELTHSRPWLDKPDALGYCESISGTGFT